MHVRCLLHVRFPGTVRFRLDGEGLGGNENAALAVWRVQREVDLRDFPAEVPATDLGERAVY
ncbi:hypothetical protein D3C72_2415080 [compost metagenome]